MAAKKKYDIPDDVLERERLRVKALRDNKTGGRLPNGAAQFVHNGITYTLSPNRRHRHGLEVKVASKEAAKESRRRGIRKNQSMELTPDQKQQFDQVYDDARLFTEATGIQHQVDHIQPIERGGIANDPNNLQIVEQLLNYQKGVSTSGPYFDAARQNGLENGAVLTRIRALNMDRAQMIEYIAQLQGAAPGELTAASQETAARQDEMSKVARKNGGINGMPDLGISEMLFGKSLVDDERQDFAR